MAISAAMVKELREKTGAGMMDCKKALTEANGDMEKATEYLREKGLAAAAKKAAEKPLIVKLSPNVTDVAALARTAEDAGADAVSLVNTFLGMAIDARRRRPVLANVTGGLSGPAIKPIALRMVHEVYQAVKIPVLGMGGIMTGTDAAEFMIAGASAVMVGSANLAEPDAMIRIIGELDSFLEENGVAAAAELVGTLEY